MAQLRYRERIVRYVIDYVRSEGSGNEVFWAQDIYQELLRRYPRFITYRMVVSVLRDKRVFEDVTDPRKERYGRCYRLASSVEEMSKEGIVNILIKR